MYKCVYIYLEAVAALQRQWLYVVYRGWLLYRGSGWLYTTVCIYMYYCVYIYTQAVAALQRQWPYSLYRQCLLYRGSGWLYISVGHVCSVLQCVSLYTTVEAVEAVRSSAL